jgi:hypothetical protein
MAQAIVSILNSITSPLASVIKDVIERRPLRRRGETTSFDGEDSTGLHLGRKLGPSTTQKLFRLIS